MTTVTPYVFKILFKYFANKLIFRAGQRAADPRPTRASA